MNASKGGPLSWAIGVYVDILYPNCVDLELKARLQKVVGKDGW